MRFWLRNLLLLFILQQPQLFILPWLYIKPTIQSTIINVLFPPAKHFAHPNYRPFISGINAVQDQAHSPVREIVVRIMPAYLFFRFIMSANPLHCTMDILCLLVTSPTQTTQLSRTFQMNRLRSVHNVTRVFQQSNGFFKILPFGQDIIRIVCGDCKNTDAVLRH